MNSNRIEHILALAARLEEPEVTWDEVEEQVAEFPGWQQLVQRLRDQSVTNAVSRTVQVVSPIQYVIIPEELRLRLLAFFRPYALLLDEAQTPASRAIALRDMGVNVKTFCEEHRSDGIAEIATAALAVAEACESDSSLLRASDAIVSDELLRVASPAAASSSALLHAAEPPDPEAPEGRRNWFQRLFTRPK